MGIGVIVTEPSGGSIPFETTTEASRRIVCADHEKRIRTSAHRTASARPESRHRVKPGITGWAQVNGYRGETASDEKMRRRLEYDLFYIENWSLGFDIRILLLTLLVPFRQVNAY